MAQFFFLSDFIHLLPDRASFHRHGATCCRKFFRQIAIAACENLIGGGNDFVAARQIAVRTFDKISRDARLFRIAVLVKKTERMRDSAVALHGIGVGIGMIEARPIAHADLGHFVVTGDVKHPRAIDHCCKTFVTGAGAIKNGLPHAPIRPERRFKHRCHLPILQRRRQHLHGTGKSVEDVAERAQVVFKIEQCELAHRVVSTGDDLRNGEGAVVGRAEHDEAAAAIPAVFVAQNVGARNQTAHGMRHQIDRRLRAEPIVDLHAQIFCELVEVAAPIVSEAAHFPAGILQAEQLFGIIFLIMPVTCISYCDLKSLVIRNQPAAPRARRGMLIQMNWLLFGVG